MRRIILLSGLALVLVGTWYLMHPASEKPARQTFMEEPAGSLAIDPQRRMGELLNNAPDPLPVLYDESRIWFTDQPSHMVVDRVHGGITPGQGSLPVP